MRDELWVFGSLDSNPKRKANRNFKLEELSYAVGGKMEGKWVRWGHLRVNGPLVSEPSISLGPSIWIVLDGVDH